MALNHTALKEPALEARSLYRFFHTGDEEILALRGVSLTVDRGEMVAIVGPSGSGKSTLLACLGGLDEPDGGNVRVAGRVLTRRPESVRSKIRAQTIGILLQSGNLVAHLDIEENIQVAQVLAKHADPTKSTDILDRLGLEKRRHATPAQLSGGEAVRAGLAVALANNPAVILADEPTAEVDDATELRILSLLRELTSDGRGIVVATHSDAVAARANRVIELVDGRIA
jgi:putative ABC transport system ATP-binding protein